MIIVVVVIITAAGRGGQGMAPRAPAMHNRCTDILHGTRFSLRPKPQGPRI